MMKLRGLFANGFLLPADWDPDKEIREEIARVYFMAEAACSTTWVGCQKGEHRCGRRLGHDGSHRCQCGITCIRQERCTGARELRRRWRDQASTLDSSRHSPESPLVLIPQEYPRLHRAMPFEPGNGSRRSRRSLDSWVRKVAAWLQVLALPS
jgi:hypothetical protein